MAIPEYCANCPHCRAERAEAELARLEWEVVGKCMECYKYFLRQPAKEALHPNFCSQECEDRYIRTCKY